MVVYGEVLFLENAIIGALLLWMTKRICGEEVSKTKLLLGAVLCGLYAFTLFQREIGEIGEFGEIAEFRG